MLLDYLVCDLVGQIVNLRPIGNRPVNEFGITNAPITNRPHVDNPPHRTNFK